MSDTRIAHDQAATIEAIITSIAHGDLDDHLYKIEYAIKSRRSAIQSEKGIRKGARVKIIAPGHDVDGEAGTVIRVNTKTATVKTDAGKEWRVPPAMLVSLPSRPSEQVMADLRTMGMA